MRRRLGAKTILTASVFAVAPCAHARGQQVDRTAGANPAVALSSSAFSKASVPLSSQPRTLVGGSRCQAETNDRETHGECLRDASKDHPPS